MKKLKLVLTISVCSLFLTFFIVSVPTANGLLLNEDFESVTLGQIPADWWAIHWSSGGCFERSWVEDFENNNVLSLASGWSSAAGPTNLVLLDYAVETDAYMMLRPSDDPPTCHPDYTRGAYIYLREARLNTPHLRGGYTVKFDPMNDKVSIEFHGDTAGPLGEVDHNLDYNTW